MDPAEAPDPTEDVTVLLTVYEDPRLERAARSVLDGDRVPGELLIADGGSTDGTWELARDLQEEHPDTVRALQLPGSVSETRNRALPRTRGRVVAFLDSDEVAPPGWLEALVAPIEAGDVDFTGGPTHPLADPASRAEAFVNRFDDWFYDRVVPRNLAALPMGNSAWRRDLLLEVGGFDPRITWGGEDYDLNLRVLAAGADGRLVEDAWCYHDQSHLSSLAQLVRRKFNYAKGATVAYLKNGVLRDRLRGSAAASVKFRHPWTYILLLVKPLALLAGWVAWQRIKRDDPTTPALPDPPEAPP